jgi:hypothetical protein
LNTSSKTDGNRVTGMTFRLKRISLSLEAFRSITLYASNGPADDLFEDFLIDNIGFGMKRGNDQYLYV